MIIKEKIMNSEIVSIREYFIIFLKTIFTIPFAIIAHIFGAIIILILIPTTIYNIYYQDIKTK